MMILARTELATIDALRASGEEPERILELIESIVNASKYEAHERDQMKLGVHILPRSGSRTQTRRGTARHQQVSRLRARDENS